MRLEYASVIRMRKNRGGALSRIGFSAAPVLRRETVLAPFLFTLYTADFSYNTPSCHLQKFSDDSAVVVGLITDGDDREYRGLIQDFADWCLRNNLQINAGKTKELVVDFRRRRHSPPAPVSIQGTDIDTVKSYKYLGVHLNDSLDWSDNTNALVKKGNSRLFLLRRLRSFGVQGLSSGPFMTLWWHQPSFMG
ncbi:hypothetical protein L3Q82_012711 [Scortum barcoo]|uniref:Uncharacterized protein n=1 Tax=Scortum barcoo TaxID=214431 RepID=A0ACB8W3U5_9TELE|nr:hypothetical protein L3Q82_012711 [Scortum barcoo]